MTDQERLETLDTMPDRPSGDLPEALPTTPEDEQIGFADTEEPASKGGIAVFLRWLVETAVLLAAAFLLAQGVRTYVLQPYVIPTGSMEPTIAIKDRVLVNRFIYRFRDPARGDIVVFSDPTGETPALIKRVVAVGGDTVDLKGGHVVLNGRPAEEPYTHDQPSVRGGVDMPLTIPSDQLWLMGDNRTNSKDSRWLGPQPTANVAGKAFFVYWPPERFGPLR